MKSVIETLLERRSIRRYERESLTPEQVRLIHDAIRNTPTSYNGQQFSVIEVTDQSEKEKLYELTNQKQIKTCERFLVFCLDYNKIRLAANAKGVDMPRFEDTFDGLIVGVVDASLAMMSALVAADACGLGTCPIGYARTAAPKEFAEILKLPKGVFVVCGLAIGVPREMPDLKPKQPESLVIFKDRYPSDEEQMKTRLMEYDDEISRYNETRSGTKSTNDWVSHIVGYYAEAMKYRLREALKNQGLEPEI